MASKPSLEGCAGINFIKSRRKQGRGNSACKDPEAVPGEMQVPYRGREVDKGSRQKVLESHTVDAFIYSLSAGMKK